jgi:2-polyprenyl-3-methyl-5-hydroxy-6-metoxy-1,4-benzoquinol methylase
MSIDPHTQAEQFFERLWREGDHWQLDTSQYERERLRYLRESVADRHYGRVLELGCGAGHFTRLMGGLFDSLLALDVAPSAIERARAHPATASGVEYRVADIMEFVPAGEGPWDLVTLVETVYYLGWLYSFFQLGWKAREIRDAIRPGGRLLLANTTGTDVGDALLLPWLIRSYRDLFVNAGLEVESESVFRGVKDGVALEVLVSLLRRPEDAGTPAPAVP